MKIEFIDFKSNGKPTRFRRMAQRYGQQIKLVGRKAIEDEEARIRRLYYEERISGVTREHMQSTIVLRLAAARGFVTGAAE